MLLGTKRRRACPKHLSDLRQADLADAVMQVTGGRPDQPWKKAHPKMFQLSALWVLDLPDLRVLDAMPRLGRYLAHQNRTQGFVEAEPAGHVGEAVVDSGEF